MATRKATPPPPVKVEEDVKPIEADTSGSQAIEADRLVAADPGFITREEFEEKIATLHEFWSSNWAFTNDTVADLTTAVFEQGNGALQITPITGAQLDEESVVPGADKDGEWFKPEYLR